MRLQRVIPRLGGLMELCSYACWACGVIVTEAAEPDERAGDDDDHARAAAVAYPGGSRALSCAT